MRIVSRCFLLIVVLVNIVNGQALNLDIQGDARVHGALDLFSHSDSSSIYIGVIPEFNLGPQNTFVGVRSGGNAIPTGRNSFFGFESGFNMSSGFRNTFLGMRSGYKNTIGSSNTYVGDQSGEKSSSGSFNVFLGVESGRCIEGDGNIVIGYKAGPQNGSFGCLTTSLDSTLIIGLGPSSSPLIYGLFDNNYVKINGRGDYASYLRVGTDEEDYPSTGEGLELVYDSNDNIGLIQAYNRDNATWSNLFLGRGHVGINTLSPSYSLDVNGRIRGNEVYCSSTNACSDIRFKHSFSEIDQALDLIFHFKGYYHYWDQEAHPDWNFPSDRQIGFKAQEVQKILPEVVSEMTDGMLAVDYAKIVPVLVEAIKEQQKIINYQKK